MPVILRTYVPQGSMATGKNKAPETRITMEIVVDCYDSAERAMGWYCYLEDKLHFPFTARCTIRRPISPLKVGDEVEVIGMPPDSECAHEMFVTIRWEKDGLAVPLAQLKTTRDADDSTRQAVLPSLAKTRSDKERKEEIAL